MKILAQAVAGNTIAGFQRAAVAAGHEWRWWDERREATFDVFDEHEPDAVFIMASTRAINKCVQEHNTVVIRGSEDTPFTFTVRDSEFPCGRLVDTHIFCHGHAHPAYECEIGITCSPHPIGLQLCKNIGEHNVKIVCEQTWGCVQYLGRGSLENKRDLYRSSTLVLVDDLAGAMRVAACGSVPVNIGPGFDNVDFAERCLEADTVKEVLRFLNDKQCQRASKTNLDSCLKGHSYDDALSVILKEIQ